MKLFIALFALLALSACKAPAPKVATCMTLMGPFQIVEDKDTHIDVSRFGVVTITKGKESLILSLSNCSVDVQGAE